jgi:hypothetical protein
MHEAMALGKPGVQNLQEPELFMQMIIQIMQPMDICKIGMRLRE